MKKILIAILILVLAFILMKTGSKNGDESNSGVTSSDNPSVTLNTSMGDVTIEVLIKESPIAAGNFLKLAKEGFYDGIKFHRVINGFMIQAGDPNTKGDDVSLYGGGGPGYTIEDEFITGLSNLRGTLSMANTGAPNSGGSQFFLNLVDNLGLDWDKEPLTSKHPVFGRVISGMDVVDQIALVETVAPMNRPVEPITINSVVVSE